MDSYIIQNRQQVEVERVDIRQEIEEDGGVVFYIKMYAENGDILGQLCLDDFTDRVQNPIAVFLN